MVEKNKLVWLKSANVFLKAFNHQAVNEGKSLASVQSSRLLRNRMPLLPSGLNEMESQILMPSSNVRKFPPAAKAISFNSVLHHPNESVSGR